MEAGKEQSHWGLSLNRQNGAVLPGRDDEACTWKPPLRWALERTANDPPARTKFSMVADDGTLHVFGGGYQKSFLGDLHAFTVATNTWRCIHPDASAVDGPCKRRSHTAIRWQPRPGSYLSKGSPRSPYHSAPPAQMIVFGGRVQHGRMNDVYLLDLQTYQWSRRPTVAGAPVERAAHAACLRGRDTMLVFGGDPGERGRKKEYLTDLWSYDLENHVWKEEACTGDVPSGRLGHAMEAVGEQLFVFGGFNSCALNHLYVCSLDTFTWRRVLYDQTVRPASFLAMVPQVVKSEAPGQPTKRFLYLWGGAYTELEAYGDTLYRLDCDKEEFSVVQTNGHRPHQRLGHCLAIVDEALYLFGGCDQEYFNQMHRVSIKPPSFKDILRYYVLCHSIRYRPPTSTTDSRGTHGVSTASSSQETHVHDPYRWLWRVPAIYLPPLPWNASQFHKE
ncbi:hypothetical protein DIPPA_29547 [Diplonema papillatum]|nr:hypothetical protein DIPPA_29547 [Diplonema papillatum]